MITVLLVDDHAAIRKILQYLIENSDDIQVVATALNGIEATRQILVLCRLTRVLMLSTYYTPDCIRSALEVGANGYVFKDAIGSDLLAGIRTLSEDKQYFIRKIAGMAEKLLLERK